MGKNLAGIMVSVKIFDQSKIQPKSKFCQSKKIGGKIFWMKLLALTLNKQNLADQFEWRASKYIA